MTGVREPRPGRSDWSGSPSAPGWSDPVGRGGRSGATGGPDWSDIPGGASGFGAGASGGAGGAGDRPDGPTSDLGGAGGTRPVDETGPVWTVSPLGDRLLRWVYLEHPTATDGPRFTFTVGPNDGWVPVGRNLGLPDQARKLDFGAVRAVPSGRLVELRCGDAGLRFRRSGRRPEYLVWVNGRPLGAGMEVAGGSEGILVYSRRQPTPGRSILRYQLEWEGAR